MRHLSDHRLIVLVITLLTLGSYGGRVFARFSACGCPCLSAVAQSSVLAGDGDVSSKTAEVAVHLLGGAAPRGQATDGCQQASGKGCSCLCHATNVAVVHAGASVLKPLQLRAATLHSAFTQRPAEGVRAGIEYPPRAV